MNPPSLLVLIIALVALGLSLAAIGFTMAMALNETHPMLFPLLEGGLGRA